MTSLSDRKSDAPGVEREITKPVDLCRSDGSLDPAAIGWTRRPLHRCNIPGWGRRKRWDYWCVASDTMAMTLTVSNVDYLGLVALYHLDRSSGREIEKAFVVPLGLGLGLPETVGGADVTFAVPGFRCAMRVEAGGTRLMVETRDRRAGALRADVLVELPEGHETLGVVIPWSERRFQYTSKHVARPARGSVEVGGTTHELEEATNAYGCLDYGRGVWAYSVHWNWGAAAGTSGGRVVGLQLGGTWTDGTGSTENAVTVDGRLSKISDDLRFGFSSAEPMSPWRITTARSDDVDLVFRPEHVHRTRIELGVVGVDVPQYFGRYAGEVSTESGRVGVDDLYGWAEDAKMRW